MPLSKITPALILLILLCLHPLAQAGETENFPCPAKNSWVSSPNPPQEIPGGGKDFCQFYQFSWQWFLYLTSPTSPISNERNFQVAANYPMLQAPGVDSCTKQADAPVVFVRMKKDKTDKSPFVIPERIGQAGGGDTIYDQQGKVVFYTVRFDKGLCAVKSGGDFPAGTTELKMAWRIIDNKNKKRYFWMLAEVDGDPKSKELLGLIGMHLVRGTAKHPEFVWATFEHKDNVPECLDRNADASRWSFTSKACSTCLKSPDKKCFDACRFNQAKPGTHILGKPTEICRVYHDASAPGDKWYKENVGVVDTLNQQLVGPGGILSTLPAKNPMAIWKNYINVGALWVSDPSKPATTDNQRGSMQLANSVMETTFQGSLSLSGSNITRGQAVNCFACHGYTPGSTTTSGLSHIFDDIHGESKK